jgi:PAS domain S-box-containing protein
VVEKILGYKPEEVINRYFYDFFLPEEREELKRKAFEVFKKKEPFKNFLNKNLTKDGRTVIVETTATPVIDKEGRLLGYRGLDRDVTEQVTSEIALCEAEERYRIQFEEALDGIVIADAQTGIIVNCNSSMAKMVKRTKEELIGQHQSILHPPEEIEGGFSKTFKQHLGEKEGEALEDKIITKEGEIRYVSIKANKLRIKEKEYLQGIFRDITETKKAQDELKIAYEKLKQTQAQLVQSAKMASVGILAGGVAHEINNPLVGVLNNVQLIKMMVQENKDFNLEEFKELLDIIEASALRCAKITRSLLDFSRSSEGLFKSVSLNELAERVIILIQHELGLQNVIIKKEFANELPLISADSQLLQQAIFDIISNAKWAIQKKSGKQGGTITLKTAYDKENKQVLLYISDTGIGIPQENLERIFEPFFTTKEVGEGTGLGLYIVYNIIKEHKGTITVESQFGKGTTFKISLPALV